MANILEDLDARAESDLREAKEKAAVFLKKWVEQRTLIAELEAQIEVRKAVGATMVQGVVPLKRESA